MSYKKVSIVLPVYNQADHIESLIKNYQTALQHISIETEFVLVVNNSHDGSLVTCQNLASEDSHIRVIHSEQGGWGLAVNLGLKDATGDLICYTNSARTSPEDLVLIIVYALSNVNIVLKANRKIRESFRRRFGSLLYNLECRSLFDFAYWDVNGTPKVFPREFDALFNLKENGDLVDLEFLIACKDNDYPVLEIPIFSTNRHSGSSTTNYLSALNMYLGAYKLWQDYKA